MEKLKTKIQGVLAEAGKALPVAEIAETLGLTSGSAYKELVKTIAQLEKDGAVQFTKVGKIQLPKENILLTGILRLNDRGFGFVNVDPEEDDIYIKKEEVGLALDGDEVAIDILHPADPFSGKGAEGKVVAIKKRGQERITGEFVPYDEEMQGDSGYLGYLIPQEQKLAGYRVYVTETGLHPVEGNIVVLSIQAYPSQQNPQRFLGPITEILGHKNDPGMDILSYVVSLGLETKFSDEVLVAAEEVPEKIAPEDYRSRRDLRDQVIVTIDGADAKDLDDAVTVRKLANGNYFLGVHIADVSHYVTENSPLDATAYQRGTSVYLTDRVIPMIPQRLSNGICSLNPQVDRLTLSCEMEIDGNGQVVHYEIFPSVIKTTARMTYQAVNEIIEEALPETCEKYQDLVPMFHEMAELHEILSAMRTRRGAINFEDREARVIVDEQGHPLDIVLRERGTGEKLIESFMLAANETVAAHFAQQNLPFIYRIHEAPKEEKLQRFFEFVSVFGLTIPGTKKGVTATSLQQLLNKVSDQPEGPVISTMLLRSMQQAKYTTEPLGHYGLGADDYTHFTSPIRRYPDLMVHRLIHTYGTHPQEADIQRFAASLPEIAQHSSQMERKAVDAERGVDAMKKAEYMASHIDEEFAGVISSVTKFGFFVELPNTIEGLVHINSLQQDYFHFIPAHMSLVGENTRQTFKLGQKVVVKVVKSDPITRTIDFQLVAAEGIKEQDLKRRQHHKRPAARGKNEGERGKRSKETATTKKRSSKNKNKSQSKGKGGQRPFYQGAKKGKNKRGKR
ncbi:ribonuclease R [Enterococcus nangangensis]|uniref:ribonuclease R n=1 Tax=Enterococcus nangangensis TaxID=2559926 RepID=UPI0010F59C57|nr:ribonuclease R [Enterococcus nangangensis]